MEPAQDEGEMFDLYDASGAPLGRSKPRGLVHRDGDWHRSIHVWVVLRDLGVPGAAAGPWVLFQRRSLAKDTWPGAVDVAVAGHVRAGETLAETLREADEEIGLHLAPEQIVTLGLRRKADSRRPGVRDNELQSILFTVTEVPLLTLRPHPTELESLLALPLAAARALFRDHEIRAEAVRLDTTLTLGREVLGASDLIPTGDGYHERALDSVAALLAGESPASWEIGPHHQG